MNLRLLAPDIQEQIHFLPRAQRGRDPIHLGQLQPIELEPDWRKQRTKWADLLQQRMHPSGRSAPGVVINGCGTSAIYNGNDYLFSGAGFRPISGLFLRLDTAKLWAGERVFYRVFRRTLDSLPEPSRLRVHEERRECNRRRFAFSQVPAGFFKQHSLSNRAESVA